MVICLLSIHVPPFGYNPDLHVGLHSSPMLKLCVSDGTAFPTHGGEACDQDLGQLVPSNLLATRPLLGKVLGLIKAHEMQ